MKKIIFLAALISFGILFATFKQSAFADVLYFTSTPSFNATVGSEYTYTLSTTDTENKNVMYALVNSPSWLMLLSGSDTIKGTPTNPGRDLVKIEATDSTGNKATQAFYINTITNTVEPTITSSTVVPTQTPEPTTSVSVFISPTQTESSILNKVALISMFPKDKSTTTSTSITIQAVLNSGFALDKRNVQFFFDNKEYTNQITLITETNSDGSFQTNLSYSTNNLSISSHTVRILVNAPDGTMIPFPWAFSVTKPVVQNPISNIKNSIINALQTRGLWILALLIILILVFIAFIGIIRRGARLSKENSQSNNPDKE